jgi:hypothetical protein
MSRVTHNQRSSLAQPAPQRQRGNPRRLAKRRLQLRLVSAPGFASALRSREGQTVGTEPPWPQAVSPMYPYAELSGKVYLAA